MESSKKGLRDMENSKNSPFQLLTSVVFVRLLKSETFKGQLKVMLWDMCARQSTTLPWHEAWQARGPHPMRNTWQRSMAAEKDACPVLGATIPVGAAPLAQYPRLSDVPLGLALAT